MIITKMLRIVPFKATHITTDYLSWLNDKELMQFSEQRHCVHTVTTCEAHVSSFDDTQNMFLALESLDGKLIGTITVYHDLQNGIVDMGIMVGDESVRGKGYGYEAWKAVADWVLQNLKPRKLTAGCMALNTPMLKIMKSVGMQRDGVRKNHYIQNGKFVDILYMAKFTNE